MDCALREGWKGCPLNYGTGHCASLREEEEEGGLCNAIVIEMVDQPIDEASMKASARLLVVLLRYFRSWCLQ